MYSVVIIFILCYVSKVLSSSDCIHFDSDGITFYCCDNRVRKNGICVECDDGYIPHDGESCKPCEDGFYGRKCALPCDCSSEMRCDNVQGCITIKDSELVTVYSSLQNRTITTLSFTESNAVSSNVIQNTSNEINSTEWNKTGLSDRERTIISTGITIFFILFAFMTVALGCLYKRRSDSSKTYVEQQLEPTNTAGDFEDQHSIEENVYNVIDESEIYDDNILPKMFKHDNHSEFVPDTQENECSSGYLKPIAVTELNTDPHPCGSSVRSEDTGYLHPYHSILPHLREKPAIYSRCETDLYLEVLPDVKSESMDAVVL
ncbi:uncharacterized protein LOC127699806 [Mytilus californianus]|uniref:uncharacterized protein LOC127699806 n=1 Tax=Mytilus californianus TaxID=6549 RepID=UPI0022476C4E|nr:uncharacterized protein LOC127699806 [Mytilus californianus]